MLETEPLLGTFLKRQIHLSKINQGGQSTALPISKQWKQPPDHYNRYVQTTLGGLHNLYQGSQHREHTEHNNHRYVYIKMQIHNIRLGFMYSHIETSVELYQTLLIIRKKYIPHLCSSAQVPKIMCLLCNTNTNTCISHRPHCKLKSD